MRSKKDKIYIKPVPRTLNVMQQVFLRNYVTNGFNKKQAAIDAGYSPKTARNQACYLLNKKEVKKYMNETMKDIQHRLGVTKEWKVQILKECAEESLNREANEGKIIPAGVVSAISELNKMAGDYAPQENINTNLNKDVETETIKELMKTHEKDF